MSRVEDEIKRANEFGDKIQDLVVAKGQYQHEERNTLLMAYWSLIFEFHRSILCLVSHKFYGAAFALARPTIEAVVRAHVVIMGSEEDVKKLRDDEYITNFAKIGKKIDSHFQIDNLFEKFLRDAKSLLHSFTHVGKMQLDRRFSGRDLTPHFIEDEIVALIRVSCSAAFIANNLVTKCLGLEVEWAENSRLFQECW